MKLVVGYKGNWYIKYQKNGKWTNRSTGTKNIKLADKFLKEFIGQQINTNIPEVTKQFTIQELINKYSEIHCNGDKNKAEEMKLRFCNLLTEYFGKDTIVNTLTSYDFEKYKNDRLNRFKHFDKSKTISPVTVNMELRAYKALFNKAIEWKFLSDNPLRKFKLCKVTKPKRQFITNAEKELLLKSIQHKVLKNIVTFALLTGCRLGEIINLQWKDIDFEDNIINIYSKAEWKTKTGEARQIPLSPELRQFLQSIFQKDILIDFDKYVFSKGNGYKYESCFISRKFKFYVRKCEIDEYIHFHSLRHTAVTDLIRSGEQINKVKEYIGHKSLQTTLGYTHLIVDDLRSTASKLTVNF